MRQLKEKRVSLGSQLEAAICHGRDGMPTEHEAAGHTAPTIRESKRGTKRARWGARESKRRGRDGERKREREEQGCQASLSFSFSQGAPPPTLADHV